jgi:hypothetical protein
MTNRVYLEDQDAEEPDDFIISLTAQVSVNDFIISLTAQVSVNDVWLVYWY